MSPDRFPVREARPADHPRIAEMTLDAYDTLPGSVSDRYREMLADVADRDTDATRVLVAENAAGRIVGSVTLVLEDGPYFEHVWGRDGDAGFRMLAVDPDHAGQGVGRALVEACLERARAAGRRTVVITTMPWMADARRLYERFGFVRAPTLDRDYSIGRGMAYVLPLDEDTRSVENASSAAGHAP